MDKCQKCKYSKASIECNAPKIGFHLETCPFFEKKEQTRFSVYANDIDKLANAMVFQCTGIHFRIAYTFPNEVKEWATRPEAVAAAKEYLLEIMK